MDGVATFESSSGKFSIFSEDRILLGSTSVNSAPCVGSEMDFCGMLVTINDDLHEHTSHSPISSQMTPQSHHRSEIFSQPTARPPPFEQNFVAVRTPSDVPVHRTDDEVLQLLMPRSMRLARVSEVRSVDCSSDGRNSASENTTALHHPQRSNPVASTQLPASVALSQVNAGFAASFRQLPGIKASHQVSTYQPLVNANIPKSSASKNAAILDDVDGDSLKNIHQSFKQPRGFSPTCIANSCESFLETLKQGVLQLPLDLDPVELTKLYEKRHMCIPDSFASLSEYSSIFRSALWEGEIMLLFASV